MNKKLFGMVALACIVGFAGCDDSSSDDAKKACGSVAHDAMTCNADGTQLAKCNDGKLEDLTGEGKCTENQVCAITDGKAACKDKATDAKKACGSVAHDAMTCNADGTQIAKCNDGKLEDLTGEGKCTENQVCAITDGKAACKDVTGDDKKACGSVAHDAMTCNANGTQLAKCNNGTLEDVTGEGKCTENQTCAIENNKAVCKDKSEDTKLDCDNAKHGELVCKGDKMAKCVNGDIVDAEGAEACATGKVCGKNAEGKAACFDAGTRPCGSTVHGAKACNGEKIATCNDGKLVNDEGVTQCVDRETHCVATDAAITCVAFKKCGDVDHYAHACDGEKMFWCYDGVKQEPAAPFKQCTGDTVCRINEFLQPECVDLADCGTIKKDEKICNDTRTQISVCTKGQFVDVTGADACTADQMCEVVNNVPTCKAKGDSIISIPAIHQNWSEYVTDTCKTNSVIKEGKTKVTGFIIAKKSNYFYMQDLGVTDGKFAGVRVQCDNNSCKFLDASGKSTELSKLNVGTIVTVEADGIGNKGCELVIGKKAANTTVTQQPQYNKKLTPFVVTADKIPADNAHNDYYGMLIEIKDVTAKEKLSNAVWKVEDATGTTQIVGGLTGIATKFVANKKYNVTGVVGNTSTKDNNYSGIKPRDEKDISEIK